MGKQQEQDREELSREQEVVLLEEAVGKSVPKWKQDEAKLKLFAAYKPARKAALKGRKHLLGSDSTDSEGAAGAVDCLFWQCLRDIDINMVRNGETRLGGYFLGAVNHLVADRLNSTDALDHRSKGNDDVRVEAVACVESDDGGDDQDAEQFRCVLAKLPRIDETAEMIMHYYGLEDHERMTLREIAARFSTPNKRLTASAVQKRIKRRLAELREMDTIKDRPARDVAA